MLILGFSGGHDAAVALVEDGRLLCAISNERLSRVKKASGVMPQMVDYVLAYAGKRFEEIHYVAFGVYYYHPDNYLRIWNPESKEEVCHSLFDRLPSQRSVDEYIVTFGNTPKPGIFIPHQMCHAAAAFFTSPFAQAVCFTLDASSTVPETNSLFAYGDGLSLREFYCPGLMIGNAYNDFTRFLGLGDGLFKAGSTMGLAAYGKPLPVARQRWEYFGESFYVRGAPKYNPDFIRLMWSEISGRSPDMGFPREESDSRAAMDIAASIQHVFTRTIVKNANLLYEQSRHFNHGNLCLSGGSFLNCDANMAIKKETRFKNIHLFPGCGDDGIAVGAALYTAHTLLKMPRSSLRPAQIGYLGCEYDMERFGGDPLDLDRVAATIAEGKVVAWFQGRSEFGPRALGNRSLLADPRHPEMRDIINDRIKHREWFRPFAPSVLLEKVGDWFDLEDASPFMLFVAQVKHPQQIPAVTHVDNTARVQTVDRLDNPLYYDLISAFAGLTGVPMLLNTSFNGGGEPLVERPEEALRFFEQSDPIVGLLVLGQRMIRREHL